MVKVNAWDVSKQEYTQLKQLAGHRWSGVWAGDLMDKGSTRSLIEKGFAENTGGSASSLDRVYISRAGLVLVETWENWPAEGGSK